MKKLTKTGENFIKTICAGNGNSLITGNNKYGLKFSLIQNINTTFTANAFNDAGVPISTNEQLGDALIVWYNKYAEELDIDANILAAQGYAESRYVMWHYSKNDSGSGLGNINGGRIFKNIVNSANPQTEESLNSVYINETEISAITKNLIEPNMLSSYLYKADNIDLVSLNIAVGNRQQLHQNIIDNPDISIRTQANMMYEILQRNGGSTASALFCYNRDYLMSENSYALLLDRTTRKYNEAYVKAGIKYVDKIFRYLGDKNNDKIPQKIDKPQGLWFGYDIDFSIDQFTTFLG